MEPFELANRTVDLVRPYLPGIAGDRTETSAPDPVRALYLDVYGILQARSQEQALVEFAENPGDSGPIKRVLRQAIRDDPASAAGLTQRVTSIVGEAVEAGPGEPPARIAAGTVPGMGLGPAPRGITGERPWGADGMPGPAADIGDRFVARLIDGGVLFGVLIVFAICGNAVKDFAPPLDTLIGIAALLVLYGYEVYAIGQYGQTLGKRAMKLRVVTLNGQRPGWGAATGRALVPAIASCFTCGLLGMLFYLSPLFDNSPYKRGWYDQIASTVVVRVP